MQILFIVIIFLIVLPLVVSISIGCDSKKKSDERLRTICTSLLKRRAGGGVMREYTTGKSNRRCKVRRNQYYCQHYTTSMV